MALSRCCRSHLQIKVIWLGPTATIAGWLQASVLFLAVQHFYSRSGQCICITCMALNAVQACAPKVGRSEMMKAKSYSNYAQDLICWTKTLSALWHLKLDYLSLNRRHSSIIAKTISKRFVQLSVLEQRGWTRPSEVPSTLSSLCRPTEPIFRKPFNQAISEVIVKYTLRVSV